VVDLITDAKFHGNRLRGFGVTGPQQTPFPSLNVNRPYDSVSTAVLHCDASVTSRNVLNSWPWSTACSAWTHVWYTIAMRYQSSRLSGVRLY